MVTLVFLPCKHVGTCAIISSMINNFVTQMIGKEESVSPDSRWVLANRDHKLTRVSSHVCFRNMEGYSVIMGLDVYVFGKVYNVESILCRPLDRHLGRVEVFPGEIPPHINSVSRTVFSTLFSKNTGWCASILLSYGGAENE